MRFFSKNLILLTCSLVTSSVSAVNVYDPISSEQPSMAYVSSSDASQNINYDLNTAINNLEQEVKELRNILEEQSQILSKLAEEKGIDLKPSSENPKLSSQNNSVQQEQDYSQALGIPEKVAYSEAYNLITQRDYAEAQKKLKQYLWEYPEGAHAANAHYWLGEIYFDEWNKSNKQDAIAFDKAQASFQAVMKNFPDHHKSMDSMLKLGMMFKEQGDVKTAENYFLQIIDKYPGTSSARLASLKLSELH